MCKNSVTDGTNDENSVLNLPAEDFSCTNLQKKNKNKNMFSIFGEQQQRGKVCVLLTAICR